MIVACSGHRPNKLSFRGYSGYIENNPLRCWIREQIRETLLELNPDHVLTGMALGVDVDMAHVCLSLKIPYIAVVPFAGQERLWRPDAQEVYRKLLSSAHEVVTVCEGDYAAWKMHARNQYLVEHSDVLLAVFDGSRGGTFSCVLYAEQFGRKVLRIDPRDFEETCP